MLVYAVVGVIPAHCSKRSVDPIASPLAGARY
jgi:hypothetical protein